MPQFTNRAYDFLKPIALIWLPAAATAYTAIAAIWGLGDVAEVVGTISAIDGLLGAALHLSTNPTPAKTDTDGQFVVDKTNPAKNIYSLVLEKAPEDLEQQDTVTLQVAHKT